jgi:hypothetical protein
MSDVKAVLSVEDTTYIEPKLARSIKAGIRTGPGAGEGHRAWV